MGGSHDVSRESPAEAPCPKACLELEDCLPSSLTPKATVWALSLLHTHLFLGLL